MARGGLGSFNNVMMGYKMGTDIGEKYNQGVAGQAYEDASKERTTPVVSGEDAYAAAQEALKIAQARGAEQGISPEEIAKQYEPTFQALEKDRARKESTQYGIGQGSGFAQSDAPFSRTAKRAAGLQATADVWYGLGQQDKGADAEAKAMALRKGELDLNRAERQDVIDKRREEIGKRWANPEQELLKRYNGDRGVYGQGEHAGKRADIRTLPNGAVEVWHVDADGNRVGDPKMFSRDDVQKEIQKEMLMDMAAADPTNTQLLTQLRQLGIAEDQMITHRKLAEGTLSHQEKMLSLTTRHYGDMALHQRNQEAIAQRQVKLAEQTQGPSSPAFQMAQIGLKKEQAYGKGMADIAKMMDDGEDPSKITEKANDLAMNHQDKMVKVKISNGDGTYREELVDPLASRTKQYAQKWAAEQTAEARQKYGGNTGITAEAGSDGRVRWSSVRTKPGPTGRIQGWSSLEELVKEENIKPRKTPERGLDQRGEPVGFPYMTHGEGRGIGGPHLGYPYNNPMTQR